jgi:hypothetical protein
LPKTIFVLPKHFNFIETWPVRTHISSKGNVTQANWNILQDNMISRLNESLTTGLEAIGVRLFGAKYIVYSFLRCAAHFEELSYMLDSDCLGKAEGGVRRRPRACWLHNVKIISICKFYLKDKITPLI